MTSSAPPVWAVGDDADPPTARTGSPEVEDSAFDLDDHDDEHLVRFSAPWWTRALSQDPLTGSIAERRRIRPAIAAAVTGDPGPAQLAALDALQAALGQACDIPGLGLSSREWTVVVAASDRCASYLHALHLFLIAGLDTAKLAEAPTRAQAKDSRRPASDELAPVLRIAGRTATALVGLARQLTDLPAAEAALVRGQMSPAQLRELAAVCRRLPEGPAGQHARAVVEARAVAAAATLSRARLAHVLEDGVDPVRWTPACCGPVRPRR